MKKIIFIAFSLLILASCKSEKTEDLNRETVIMKEFLSQFFDVNSRKFIILKTDQKLNQESEIYKFMGKNIKNGYQSFSFEALDETKGKIVVESATQNIDNKNDSILLYTTYVNYKDQLGGNVTYLFIIEKTKDEKYMIKDFIKLDSVNKSLAPCNYSEARTYGECFSTCMGCMLDTNEFMGQAITGLGIVSGFGCGPCGVAAGVLFGIGTLACLGC
ncbi:MAG: lipoprotein [Tenuifilum sp.]|jgi:uncharacterized protein YcfL|uniref:hypothetical protein n=1 Tax=Tenuifilum sp. TaxID=2760880 RepID=UPI001B3FEDC3|nr:hypothetical protein [Bacteroidales bacterium]HOK62080.1 hypothetical protein [Tenuifilum sp.]HQK41582.1 hypothetical protein [bacterium]HOK86911.1 hypothetical protein [Tenuifilum sp.]HON69871.1 hypothetical protein [Tenuifilum sp.]